MSDSLPPRSTSKNVSAVRGSLLVSSISALRENGHFERYRSALDPALRDEILHVLASSWVPLELATHHYATCTGLPMSADERLRMGEFVGQRIQGAFMTTLTRALRFSGLTPWTLLDQFDRLWRRLMLGGSVAIERPGPKDAQLELVGLALFRFEHFRIGFSGVIHAGFRLVGTTAFRVRLVDVTEDGMRVRYRAAWV